MNKIYRLVWNKKSNSLVAVSEAAKSKRQGTSPSKSKLVGAVAAALLSLSANSLKAGPLQVGGGIDNETATGWQSGLDPHDISNLISFTNNGELYFFSSGLVNTGNPAAPNRSTNISNDGQGIYATDGAIHILGSADVSGDPVVWSPGLAGTINNNSTLDGGLAGILIEAGTVGTILNTTNGFINSNPGTGIDIHAGTVAGSFSGGILPSYVESIQNNGIITGTTSGISVVNSTISLGIQNFGSGAEAYLGTFTGGIIEAPTAISLNNATIISGGISNSGYIQGYQTDGIQADQTHIISGNIINSGDGIIRGGNRGIYFNDSTLGGSILNQDYGRILSGEAGSAVSGGSAILVSGSSAVQGSITNDTNAEIVAFESSNHGIEINASTVSGGIINRGTIAAYLNAGVSINNSNYVSGISNTGIIVSLGGSVEAIQTIDGRDASASVGISTTPVGVNIVSSNVGSFANTGSAAGIIGLNTGLRLTGTTISGIGTSISNSGTIAGAYTVGVTGAGIKMDASTLNGSLVNSGVILGGTYGLEVETSSILGNISNSGLIQGTTGSGISIANSPTVGSIINASGGTISGHISGIYAYNSQITSITNNGYIESDGYAILSAYNTNVSGNIENNGLISLSDGYGIYNSGTLGSGTLGGSIINRGTINKSDPQSSFGGIGIFNSGSMVGGITNTGSIIMNSGTAGNEIGILVQNPYFSTRTPNIFNSGYVYGGTDALAVLSYGGYGFSIVDQIENSGTGILSGGETGIYLGDLYTPAFGVSFSSTIIFFPTAYVGSIINRGTIRAEDVYGSGILNEGGTIGGITNSGLIIGGATGTGIYNMGSIGTILNEGTGRITALSTHVDIYNDPAPNVNGQPMGTIDLLINSKGGASPNTPLTFGGRLPTAYQIIVNSTAQYGQLAVTNPSGTMSFNGIYHTSSLTGNHTYVDVITNVGTSNLTGTLSGLFNNRYPWLLSETSYGNWDLITSAPSGPGAIETQSSLRQVANALKSPFVTKNIALNNALNYDCNLFDQRGMCVSLGGAYSQAAGSNTQASSGVVVLGYQFNNQFRVGGYLDQQIHNKNSTAMVSMSDSSPLMGAFAVWNKNANLQGAQVKWSSGYSRHDLSLARPIVDEASEPGSGNTQIKAWGTSLIGSYMVPINDRLSASPYAGIRYSRIKANGYSETFNNDVQTPLTFADLTQKSTAALIGAKLYTQINDRLNILASVGLEHDMSYKGGRYLGTGDVETSAIDFNPNSNQTRMNASIGAYFDVAKKQRIGANIFWTEQPFTDKNSTSLFVNYTLGL